MGGRRRPIAASRPSRYARAPMALRILNAGPTPEEIVAKIREAIDAALPGAEIEARCASPGHFEIAVTSGAFDGLSRLQQHQKVYGAIAPLMSGSEPPIHAVDRLDCRLPGSPG